MRKEYGKALRKEFVSQLSISFPEFQPFKSDDVPPGDRWYSWRSSEGFSKFVGHFAKNQDSFTVEIGWNGIDLRFPVWVPFPNLFVRPWPPSQRFRISRYWSIKDPWWEIEPTPTFGELIADLKSGVIVEPDINEHLPEVPLCVADVMEKLQKYAVPTWREAETMHLEGLSAVDLLAIDGKRKLAELQAVLALDHATLDEKEACWKQTIAADDKRVAQESLNYLRKEVESMKKQAL